MSASKSNYPHRPPAMRPKKPGKGLGRPSTHSGGRKSKTWLSAMTHVENNNRDISPRLSFPWYRSPAYAEARRLRHGG